MKNRLKNRSNPIDLNKEDFRKMGYQLVDSIADFMDTIEENPVTTAESSREIRKIMGTSLLPEKGLDADVLLSKTTDLFLNHSLQNGHPKFMGYITSS
ncbi:MAG: hypothetical protein OEW75_12985, partial [Cyclobacteriaceae bacterium]|nr:hypothetical protein [Cyclobacteriaceae bacterium]